MCVFLNQQDKVIVMDSNLCMQACSQQVATVRPTGACAFIALHARVFAAATASKQAEHMYSFNNW